MNGKRICLVLRVYVRTNCFTSHFWTIEVGLYNSVVVLLAFVSFILFPFAIWQPFDNDLQFTWIFHLSQLDIIKHLIINLRFMAICGHKLYTLLLFRWMVSFQLTRDLLWFCSHWSRIFQNSLNILLVTEFVKILDGSW